MDSVAEPLMDTLYAEILLPLHIPGTYTYRVPRDMASAISEGMRAVVQFGKKKLFTGIVRRLHHDHPGMTVKYVLGLLDDHPAVLPQQLAFWDWMADYYMCHPGDVMAAALPSALKLGSETRISIHPDFAGEADGLDDEQLQVLDALQERGPMSMDELATLLRKQHALSLVRRMEDLRLVMQMEELQEKFKPRMRTFFALADWAEGEAAQQELFASLGRAPKQLDALMQFLQLWREQGKAAPVSRERLVDDSGTAPAMLDALVKKGILLRTEEEESRLRGREAWADGPVQLTEGQQQAISGILSSFEEKDTVLLFGVTGSGKTEVYIRLIEEQLAQGKQVLYMLPEIALTTQIIHRLQKHFGERVGMYHSRMSDRERAETWRKQLGLEPYAVVLGARSSLFLPFRSLGLAIVDEEHEQTFKQHEPAPRYHGRDAAAMLARRAEAKLLLGSATPSVEAYYNASRGKFGLVRLSERFGGARLPDILICDLSKERKENTMKGAFSSLLLGQMKATLARGEQVIIFQNRRGFSSFVMCSTCHHVPDCQQCDITLTYHKHSAELRCHYCGYARPMPKVCAKCNGTAFKTIGFGTEQVEEELAMHFPDTGIARMDLDTTRGKHAYQRIITDFEERRVSILVGTQMVTKGLDFDHVGLVGVLNADQLLNYPDFRAFERAFQLMAQVSGRAGRKKKQGRVIIQASSPTHFVLEKVVQNDYAGLFENELQQRRTYRYPPFVKMVRITAAHPDRDLTERAANALAEALSGLPDTLLLGPEFPAVERVRNRYRKFILMKMGGSDVGERKREVMKRLREVAQRPEFRSVQFAPDADPY